MNDHTIPQNMKIYNTDYYLETSNIHRMSSGLALSAVEYWINDITSNTSGPNLSKQIPLHFRFFYADYLYHELMFRWKCNHADDQPPQLVLARVELQTRFRGKGHFKKLMSGLEEIARQHGTTLLVEQANPELSRILMGQGYLRCNGTSADTSSICVGLRGTWKYRPVGGQSMGLIALPDSLLKQIDGSRVPSNLQTKIDRIVHDEIKRFQEELQARLECEILPEVMSIRQRDRELANGL